MEATTTLVSLTDLRKLLSAIGQRPHAVRIRFRTLGQLWYPNFLRVLKMEQGRRILFHDAIRNEFIVLSDVNRIAQFELDGRQFSYQPQFQYEVSDDGMNEDP